MDTQKESDDGRENARFTKMTTGLSNDDHIRGSSTFENMDIDEQKNTIVAGQLEEEKKKEL